MDSMFAQLSDSVSSARTLEELTRPLLEMLEAVTGLESTYLTTIDLDKGEQHILYARNTRAMQIPEGLTVPWHDTLCKRALDECRPFTDNVAEHWGDSDAAKALGIQTYVSTPVRTSGEQLYGTLCAASSTRQPLTVEAENALRLFAGLIGKQVEREQLLGLLQKSNDELRAMALTDWLTGLPNRRALMGELHRALARARRAKAWVLVGAIDLDDFKRINDEQGHDAGDDFLRAIATALSGALRAGDVMARFGGDEFVLVATGPSLDEDCSLAVRCLRDRLAAATVGEFKLGGQVLRYRGASVGVVGVDPVANEMQAALRLADAAMYEAKNARRRAAAAAAAAK